MEGRVMEECGVESGTIVVFWCGWRRPPRGGKGGGDIGQ